DADGKRYIDYMCGYGPNLLGYGHDEIDAAYIDQLAIMDVATGPGEVMVDLAEAFTGMIGHADWAMFCKNGTDASSMALLAARAYRGKRKVIFAKGAYHGAAPWCTPMPAGTVAEDRAHFIYCEYNNAESLAAAVEEAGDDLAAIFCAPFKHDVLIDQELPEPDYARLARKVCDEHDALLVVDDIRAGFRLARECSWSALGVAPDLSLWGKAIANGHPLSALLGNDRAREAAGKIFVTGSFWFSAAAMAASVKTLQILQASDYLERTLGLGERLRDGLAGLAGTHGLPLSQTGPVQMPLIMFDGDGAKDLALGTAFVDAMLKQGIYFHTYHNMFLSAAMTPADIDQTLDAAEAAMKGLSVEA
ncbi:MAG: aminotransferase class III-fold pyridoxal phosphate-dependent enzyme, partial [Pseudomonadota bacterium]